MPLKRPLPPAVTTVDTQPPRTNEPSEQHPTQCGRSLSQAASTADTQLRKPEPGTVSSSVVERLRPRAPQQEALDSTTPRRSGISNKTPKKHGLGKQDSLASQQASKKQRTSVINLSTLQARVHVSPELNARLQNICYSNEDCLLGNTLVDCLVAGATYCKMHPESLQSWANDSGAQPDNQSMSLESAMRAWEAFSSASKFLSNVTTFVVSWLHVVASLQRATKGKPRRCAGKKSSSGARTRRHREGAIGQFLIHLINNLSESSGEKAYNVCSALAGRCTRCCWKWSFAHWCRASTVAGRSLEGPFNELCRR